MTPKNKRIAAILDEAPAVGRWKAEVEGEVLWFMDEDGNFLAVDTKDAAALLNTLPKLWAVVEAVTSIEADEAAGYKTGPNWAALRAAVKRVTK